MFFYLLFLPNEADVLLIEINSLNWKSLISNVLFDLYKALHNSIKYLWAKWKLRYVYKYSLLKANINILNIVSDLSIFMIGFLTTQRRWQTCYDYISVLQNKRNWIWYRITIFISKFDFRINVYLQPLHVNILFFESSSFGWFSLLLQKFVK